MTILSSVSSLLAVTHDFFAPPPCAKEEVKSELPHELLVELTTSSPTFRADPRISRARSGVPGVYRLYLEDGVKIIFKVWSVNHRESGRLIVRIFPVSYYDAGGVLVKKVVRSEGVANFYFSRNILWGNWNPDRIPDPQREELEFWAPLFQNGVKCYNNKSKKRLDQQENKSD